MAADIPATLRTVGLVARVWRGDGPVKKLKLAPRGFLLELHFLAVDEGTWPFVPADAADLAAMLGMNPRPVETHLDLLTKSGFVQILPDDLTRLRLRRIDALIQWRPLDELR